MSLGIYYSKYSNQHTSTHHIFTTNNINYPHIFATNILPQITFS